MRLGAVAARALRARAAAPPAMRRVRSVRDWARPVLTLPFTRERATEERDGRAVLVRGWNVFFDDFLEIGITRIQYRRNQAASYGAKVKDRNHNAKPYNF